MQQMRYANEIGHVSVLKMKKVGSLSNVAAFV